MQQIIQQQTIRIIKRCLVLAIAHIFIVTSLSAQALASEIWTYQAHTGPDHWADLDDTFTLCSSGKSQSPTNLTAAVPADLINPDFHYRPVPLNLLNNGHTVQIPYAPGSYVILEGDRYHLRQLHFHSPSEHTIDSQPWDAELHLVHQNDSGDLAVVAVLLQADSTKNTSSDAYRLISHYLPAHSGDKIRTQTLINAQDLLPNLTTTYRYTGSLTTPPCSESVIWLVMSAPVSLSAEDIARYKTLLNHNNRPLQALNDRIVQIDVSP